MERISDFIVSLADFMWGTWMTVLLVSTGIILSFLFRFRYQTKIGFHFKNTYLKMFRKGEGIGTVSGFAAACTALANTVGTGNISGVATAVTMGGQGQFSGCGFRAFSGCQPRLRRSFSASATV